MKFMLSVMAICVLTFSPLKRDENAAKAETVSTGQGSGIETELKLLRDQVDLLQVKASEERKPWYQQPTTLISLLAFLLSAVTAIYTQIGKSAEEIRSKKEEMRKLVADLLEFRQEFQSRVLPIINPQEREFAGILLNNKRMIALEAAESLAAQIAVHVSPPEYGILIWPTQISPRPNTIISRQSRRVRCP